MKASSICGSDIRAIYREHLGTGAEAYQGVIAGHEPCGQVVAVGPATKRLAVGDRVVIYHIAGCGVCEECRHGYMIGCSSPAPRRARVAARRRPRRVPARRGSHLHPAARAVDVRRRRARVVRLRDRVRRPAAPPTVGAGSTADHRARARSGSLPPCSAARWVPVRSSAPTSPRAPAHGARRRPRRPRRRRRGRGAGDHRRALPTAGAARRASTAPAAARRVSSRSRAPGRGAAARSSARVARCRSRCPTC